MTAHKSGFVNIIGNPNVGKSTLMNALVGEKMSIITSKPQTTRHRIFGLLSEDDYQVVFSDTPGIIDRPIYGMQTSMNKFAFSSFEDADIILFVTDIFEKYTGEEPVLKALLNTEVPKYLIINKIDIDKD
ncbi:MAG TPA: 50S ribosome-binding GTPase, partial [Saprospiraceae bacterium]|nr:50S ribosome-binding GTPase [Saprospiraceae bacterium]